MKLQSLLIIGLAASVCVGSQARARKKIKDVPSMEIKGQSVDAKTFSYAMGVYQAEGLRNFIQQREGIDSTLYPMFLQGLNSTMSENERKELYAMVSGMRISEQLEQQMIPAFNKQAVGKADSTYCDVAIMKQAITEGLLRRAAFSGDSAQRVVDAQFEYQTQMLKNLNQQYLVDNGKRKGVITTPSGLQYEVLTKGTGALPTDSSEVEVHYEGKLIDGTKFDSSYDRGKTATFGVQKVIKGWTEGLQLMPVGSTYMLYIPYQLAYGERGNRNIPPFSTLVFKVELVSIKK